MRSASPRFFRLSVMTAPALAQTDDGEVKQMREACAKSDVPQDQIDACTKLIDTRLLQGRELAQALYQRGAGHAAKGEYQEAVRDYTQALKFAPDSSDALYNRGGAYSKLGRWDDALADFDALLKIVPNDPNTHLCPRLGPCRSAARTRRRSPTSTRCWRSRRTIRKRCSIAAGINIRAGRYDDAIRDFGALLKLDPKAAAAAYNRGRAYYAKRTSRTRPRISR